MRRNLVRYDFVAGTANDTGALYVNPTTTDGSGDTSYVEATTLGVDAALISFVNIRQGTNGAVGILDNISVVGTIPEPSAALLGAIGALGLLRRRR